MNIERHVQQRSMLRCVRAVGEGRISGQRAGLLVGLTSGAFAAV